VGGVSANTAVSEFADRPPTPDPSPPLASLVEGGEKEIGRSLKPRNDESDYSPIAATASISISQPGCASREM
jgi:hypothetical protein